MIVSVLICTFNGAARLPRTLAHLAAQVYSGPWELLLVANACTDESTHVAATEWARLGVPVPLRIYMEPEVGKAHAIERGFIAAQGRYLVVCDDDNWLAPDYLQLATGIMDAHPEIGALGGRGDALCEGEAPEWFDRYQACFAVGSRSVPAGDASITLGVLPGAGMTLRKSSLEALWTAGYTFTDRIRGDDTEICLALRLAGYSIWYDERLRYGHFIPRRRLTWSHFLELSAINGRVAPYWTAYHEIMAGRFTVARPPGRWYWTRKVLPSIANGHLARVLGGLLLHRLRRRTETDRYRSLVYQWNVWVGFATLRGQFVRNICTLLAVQARLTNLRGGVTCSSRA